LLIMKEMHSYENEMRRWTPRPPSPRVARRLFGQAQAAPLRSLRAAIFWMTPVAACALTILLTVGSLNHPSAADDGKDLLVYADVPGAASPNAQASVRMSQMDENVEWNVPPHLTPPSVAPVPVPISAPAPSFAEPRNTPMTNLTW
jgi:hypothetical protein